MLLGLIKKTLMKNNFKNKKVTVMGLGLHGGGIATVLWLVNHGAKVTVTDLKTKAQLKAGIDQLGKTAQKVTWVLGKHREADFRNTDMVVQNPGVPRDSGYLKIAKEKGILIENQASLFLKNCPAKVIGVTGTRGKSTTSALIHSMLSQKFNQKNKVWLVGLSQMPMLSIVDKIKKDDLVVAELSSWQLEVLGSHKISPTISVVTNLFEDHLNSYQGMKDYGQAKKNIFLFQNKEDICIINYDNKYTSQMGKEVVGQRIWISLKKIKDQNAIYLDNQSIIFRFKGKEVKLMTVKNFPLNGKHNLYNALGAMAVASTFGASVSQMLKAMKNYHGLPGRMEQRRAVNGVSYINDTTATTPDATRVGLEQMTLKNTVLIAGGETKNISQQAYDGLAKEMVKKCKAIILLSGRGSEQIIKSLKKYKVKVLVQDVSNIVDAFQIAQSLAKKGDNILLSPACASFNMFINEFDRGDQFNKLVSLVKNKK
jgi:UDP-N-acetylmuramoylalanine--D-glutamate ligase